MNIFLFNRGLRCNDNTTLIHMIRTYGEIIPIFVFTEQVNQKKNEYFSHNSVEFMIESLHELADTIHKKYDGKLYFFHNDNLIKLLGSIHKTEKIANLGTNFDYTPYAIKRQEDLKDFCNKNKINFIMKEDHVLFPILDKKACKENGEPYTVFTPYKNHVLKNLEVPEPDKFKKFNFKKHKILESNKYYIDMKDINMFYESNPNKTIIGGRKAGLKILKNLGKFKDYTEERDMLTYHTTCLASYNHFGVVSIREVFYMMKDKLKSKSIGLITEICWRDFYYNLFYYHPHMLGGMIGKKNTAYKDKFNHIKWNYNKNHFERWCNGTLGIPVCDAGMRQMNTTGIMHNRLRMVTAAVLTKLLMLPWQWGEKYFAQKLKDYDPIQNGGGWGWTITGIDPQQVFRIFSPQSQSVKFDPECEFILSYIPELKNVPIKDIHNWEETYQKYLDSGITYYKPAIDYKESRKLALEEFKRVNKL
jgi:deoxyribodipyrimidine photo-lyase